MIGLIVLVLNGAVKQETMTRLDIYDYMIQLTTIGRVCFCFQKPRIQNLELKDFYIYIYFVLVDRMEAFSDAGFFWSMRDVTTCFSSIL